MARTIHARLDKVTANVLRELQRRFGWTDSQAVCAAIKALNGLLACGRSRGVIGLGRFCSGVPDLGSRKDHLEGFGR